MLVIFGLVILTSASSDLSKARFGDSYYYLKHQILFGLLPGLAGFFAAFSINYQNWKKWGVWLLAGSVILLLLVFTPLGFKAYGSERWLSIAGVGFQPGELVKITFIVYMAAWIGKSQSRSKNLKEGFIPFLILSAGVLIPLILQPSTTIAVLILAAVLAMYFTAGAKIRFLFPSER